MSLPAMATGLVMDDYLIETAVARGHNPFTAFEFHSRDPIVRRAETLEDRAAGRVPWWIDEEFHQAFLRPITSLTHALDFRLWPRAVPWMHLESIAVFALVVWLAGLIYTELALPRAALGLATFFYAMSGHHALSVAWLSGRNTLLATAFGLLAIWLHLRAAKDTGSRQLLLQLMAAAALGCGLLSAEFGAGAAGFLLAHALTLRDGPLVRRLLALWPYAVVLVAWQAAYIAGNYGAIGSGFYHGPAQEPGLFARGVVTGLPIYLASQFVLPIAAFSCFYPSGLAVVTSIALASLFLMRGLLLPLWRSDRRARFLLAGAALAILPLGSTVAQDRLVFFVSLGTSAIIALLLAERFDPLNFALPREGAKRLFRIHAIYLPITFVPMLFSFGVASAAGGGTTALADALPSSGERGVVLLNVPLLTQLYYQKQIRVRRGLPELPFLDVLYAGGQPIEMRRSSERSLEVEVARGYFAATIENFVRNPARRPFRAGDVVQLPRMRVTVLAVNGDGAPTRVRFEWNDVLERLGFAWMAWDGRAPKAWPLPPVGGHATLPALQPFP
jgi:hypothetical protein